MPIVIREKWVWSTEQVSHREEEDHYQDDTETDKVNSFDGSSYQVYDKAGERNLFLESKGTFFMMSDKIVSFFLNICMSV